MPSASSCLVLFGIVEVQHHEVIISYKHDKRRNLLQLDEPLLRQVRLLLLVASLQRNEI